MLQISATTRIYLCTDAVDFRKGINKLISLCQHQLQLDPYSGHLFVFRNRKGTSLKVLGFDGHGVWVCQKRFSQGNLRWWPVLVNQTLKITPAQLQVLLWNGHPSLASFPENWREIT